MPVSYASVTTNKMELTPMRVNFNGVDLGGTLSNVVVKVEFKKAEIKADQSGETPRDRRVSGLIITVDTELAQIRDKDIWKVVFPHAKEVVNGGNKMMYFQAAVGDSDLANSQILILHPLSLVDADLSGDYKFFKACASAVSEAAYGPTGQTKLKVTWNILPDDSVSPERFFIHGDPSIGLTAASAAQAYSGTGNGTMTSLTAYNGVTKTETITVACVAAVTNGGKFTVVGSLSGSLGLAIVGTPFVPGTGDPVVVSFTINDGATDFIVGDTFTLTMTASNYA